MEAGIGDEVVVYLGKLTRAVVTDVWPSRYDNLGHKVGVLEIEYDNMFFGKTKQLVDEGCVRSVRPREQKR